MNDDGNDGATTAAAAAAAHSRDDAMIYYDLIVIGGGVVGLACLRAATLKGWKCALVEAETDLLTQASGGNSGIVCTGVDASVGTLERALIRDSVSEFRSYCESHNVPMRPCGSLVCLFPWDLDCDVVVEEVPSENNDNDNDDDDDDEKSAGTDKENAHDDSNATANTTATTTATTNANKSSRYRLIREDEWTRSDLEEHDALIRSGQNPFRNFRVASRNKLGPPAAKHALETLRERCQKLVLRDLEHESFGNRICSGSNNSGNSGREGDLLPTLVVVAALEDALQASLRYQLAKESERAHAEGGSETGTRTGAGTGTRTGTAGTNGASEGGLQHQHQYHYQQQQQQQQQRKRSNKHADQQYHNPPLYYSSNPLAYLRAPTDEDDSEARKAAENPKAVVTPAVLGQRIRDGCQWAWNYLQQQENEGVGGLESDTSDDENENDGDGDNDNDKDNDKDKDNDNDNDNDNDKDPTRGTAFLDGPDPDAIAATTIALEEMTSKAALLEPLVVASSACSEDARGKQKSASDVASASGQDTTQQVVRRSGRASLGERGELLDPGHMQTQRRSTRGGGRSSSSRSRSSNNGYYYNYNSEPNLVPEPTPVQKGGRVALWWLQLLKQEKENQRQARKRQRRRQKNGGRDPDEVEGKDKDEDEDEGKNKDKNKDKDKDKDENAMDVEEDQHQDEDSKKRNEARENTTGKEAPSKPKPKPKSKSTPKSTPKSKPDEAAAASNMVTGDSYEDAMKGDESNEDEDDQTNDNQEDDDEDFDMSKDGGDADDSEDDRLEDVTRERSLTPVPDLQNSDDSDGDGDGDEQEDDDEEDDEDDDEEEDDEIDEEQAIVWDNPYLEPSLPALLEYLSKPKSISGEDVQAAVDEVVLRMKHTRPTAKQALAVCNLMDCDRALLHWENKGLVLPPTLSSQEANFSLTLSSQSHPLPHLSIALKCVSGETVQELQRLDAGTFGRCKFELEPLLPGNNSKTPREDALARSRELEEQMVIYKARKQHDRWRYKGIHEGHAIWPSWETTAEELIRSKIGDGSGGSEAAASGAEGSSLSKDAKATGICNSTTSAGAAAAAVAAPDSADDEALARSLANSEQTAATATSSSSSGRRSTRRGKTASGSEGVFYGTQSNMTQKQLMDALLRIVTAATSVSALASSSSSSLKVSAPTLATLRSTVADDSSDPLRRIRIALGKILWKRNLLARCPVTCKDSDGQLRSDLLGGKQLVTIRSRGGEQEEEDHDENHKDNGTCTREEENKDDTNTANNYNYNDNDKAIADADADAPVRDLLDYLSHLHTTELRLRNMVLEQLGAVPIPVIATAADERIGTMETMDATDFEDLSAIEFSEDVPLAGAIVYRPNLVSTLGLETTACYWYRIKDASASIPSDADDAEEGSVERRQRFRAVPCDARGNVLNPKSDPNSDDKILLLTEAQVHAGIKAGELQKQRESEASGQWGSSHPFGSEIGEHITLLALDDGDEDEDEHRNHNGASEQQRQKHPSELSGRIVGHDSVWATPDDDDDDAAENDVEFRILFLPDEPTSKDSDATKSSKSPSPFWAVLDVRADDASYVCQPVGTSTWYSIEHQDFHVDSEPYRACQTILDWLSRQSKAMPFMEPVDPVALGIPTYPDIVKNPMDVSTMVQKLEQGAYSSIPPGRSMGNSPVCRMLNGPFRRDLELIFDNAVLFNPPDDWISVAALALKKTVLKKIETAASAAEAKHGEANGSKTKSPYLDEDSDVDVAYEYESDEDFVSSRRGKRKRATARSAGSKDEAAARPIEHPIKLSHCLKDGNDLRGRFAGLSRNGVASTFSMPSGWSCRYMARAEAAAAADDENGNENDEDNDERSEASATAGGGNQEYKQEMAELLALQKRFGEAETSNLRRSSRESRPTAAARRANNKKRAAASRSKTEGLEYYHLRASGGTGSGGESPRNNKFPTTRSDLEILQEKRHEDHYAKLYQTHESELEATNESGCGIYSTASFPPYLGKVVPKAHGSSWEIRPSFAVPALRWVLRGLVRSGHLTATEPLCVAVGGSAGHQNTTTGSILTNDVYYKDPAAEPFCCLDTRELQRKKRAGGDDDDDSSEDQVEMSEYEKLRAERVARNAERLKALGLA